MTAVPNLELAHTEACSILDHLLKLEKTGDSDGHLATVAALCQLNAKRMEASYGGPPTILWAVQHSLPTFQCFTGTSYHLIVDQMLREFHRDFQTWASGVTVANCHAVAAGASLDETDMSLCEPHVREFVRTYRVRQRRWELSIFHHNALKCEVQCEFARARHHGGSVTNATSGRLSSSPPPNAKKGGGRRRDEKSEQIDSERLQRVRELRPLLSMRQIAKDMGLSESGLRGVVKRAEADEKKQYGARGNGNANHVN